MRLATLSADETAIPVGSRPPVAGKPARAPSERELRATMSCGVCGSSPFRPQPGRGTRRLTAG